MGALLNLNVPGEQCGVSKKPQKRQGTLLQQLDFVIVRRWISGENWAWIARDWAG
jgi:hypothetical protein